MIRRTGRIAATVRLARSSLSDGIPDAVSILRHHPAAVLIGSVGATAFDLAVLAVSFRAFGYSPPLGVLVLGYLIGQLGGNLPVPGGIGGLDGGLIAVFVLYHAPLAATTAAVLVYHAISFWVPALVGSTAFVQLRNTLRREPDAAAICAPMAEPIEIMRLARATTSPELYPRQDAAPWPTPSFPRVRDRRRSSSDARADGEAGLPP
jgi:hypothetical protein